MCVIVFWGSHNFFRIEDLGFGVTYLSGSRPTAVLCLAFLGLLVIKVGRMLRAAAGLREATPRGSSQLTFRRGSPGPYLRHQV